jgi:hypothetical protein
MGSILLYTHGDSVPFFNLPLGGAEVEYTWAVEYREQLEFSKVKQIALNEIHTLVVYI